MLVQLLLGFDPGPLPGHVQTATFSSWRVIDSGDQAGSLRFTVARPGTMVEAFRLDWNGVPGYATVGNGASAFTIGDWQLVQVMVAVEDIHVPSGTGEQFVNEYEIVMDTDRGSALPNRARLEIELKP